MIVFKLMIAVERFFTMKVFATLICRIIGTAQAHLRELRTAAELRALLVGHDLCGLQWTSRSTITHQRRRTADPCRCSARTAHPG